MYDTPPLLGIDFGTCFSSAALLVDGEVRPVKEPFSRSWSFPSSVCLADDGNLLVGTPAERRKRMLPTRYRSEFKRDLGEEATISLGERPYRPDELTTEVLKVLKKEAEQLAGEALAAAVVTVPASYEVHRRTIMRKAAEGAGFDPDQITLLEEPVAAAFAPARGREFGPGDLVLVYDFGGGTFDTALVRMGEHGRPSSAAALDDCGGSDIDRLLYADIQTMGGVALDKLLRPARADAPTDARTWRVRLELLDFAREIKHQLSESTLASDFFSAASLPYEIDRQRFKELAGPKMAMTVACCRDLLKRNHQGLTDVAGVLLVGGSTRMPMVAEVLEQELGRPLRWTEDPKLAVAIGAAYWHRIRRPRQPATPKVVGEGDPPQRWEPEWEDLDTALQLDRLEEADELSKAIIRRHARVNRVDSREIAERIPLQVMRELQERWSRAGSNLRQREWLYFERGVNAFLPDYPFSWRHVRLRTFWRTDWTKPSGQRPPPLSSPIPDSGGTNATGLNHGWRFKFEPPGGRHE